jgi:hypothetical protein
MVQEGAYLASLASSASQGIAEQGAETIAKNAVAGAVKLQALQAALGTQSTTANVIAAQQREEAEKRARWIEDAQSFSVSSEKGPSYAVNNFKG